VVDVDADRAEVGEGVSEFGELREAGKVSFDAERTGRGGHADRFWAIALACQKERGPSQARGVEIGARVLG